MVEHLGKDFSFRCSVKCDLFCCFGIIFCEDDLSFLEKYQSFVWLRILISYFCFEKCFTERIFFNHFDLREIGCWQELAFEEYRVGLA